jgi:hypothetical protein
MRKAKHAARAWRSLNRTFRSRVVNIWNKPKGKAQVMDIISQSAFKWPQWFNAYVRSIKKVKDAPKTIKEVH